EGAIDAETGAFSFGIEGLIEGNNVLTIRVEDGSGVGESFERAVVSEAGVPVALRLDSPAAGESFDVAPVTVAGAIDTVQGVGRVSYTLNGGDAVIVDATLTEGTLEEEPDAEGDAVVARQDFEFAIEDALLRGANVLVVTAAD